MLKYCFPYLFSEKAEGGGHARISLIEQTQSFNLAGLEITPIPMLHGSLETTGWLLTEETSQGPRSIAYLTDCNFISDESIELIHKGCKLENGGRLVHLVIDGLRIKEHSTHFNFLQALETAGKIGADHIWFTHLTHNSSHEETAAYIKEHRADFPALAAAQSILPAHDELIIHTGG